MKHSRFESARSLAFSLSLLVVFSGSGIALGAEEQQTSARFAVIGDYGNAGSNLSSVASMVRGWNPDFVITTGDNNYPNGASSTIDRNIGQYYHSFIKGYKGSYGSGSSDVNRFFPCLGNHDWIASGAKPYLDYFTLPGNERYYDFAWGPVHFFSIDSDTHEPSGTSSSSTQGKWLKSALAAAKEPWKIVYFHHSAYSSGEHGSTSRMQWPFKSWGASIVLSGHDHHYERINRDGLNYIVNGLGGASRYNVGRGISGSLFRYSSDYGAQLVEATATQISFKFYNKSKNLIDSFTLGGSAASNLRNDEVSLSGLELQEMQDPETVSLVTQEE